MASKLEIWSMVSVAIGNGPQTSLSASNAFIRNITPIYETVVQSRLTWQRWGFAKKKAALSRNATDPLNEWAVSYQIPAGALQVFKLYPNVPYTIYGDDIFTNSSSLECDYLERVDEGNWPAYFNHALVIELASMLAYPVTNNASLASQYGNEKSQAWLSAAAADAQGRTMESVQDKPLIFSRFVS